MFYYLVQKFPNFDDHGTLNKFNWCNFIFSKIKKLNIFILNVFCYSSDSRNLSNHSVEPLDSAVYTLRNIYQVDIKKTKYLHLKNCTYFYFIKVELIIMIQTSSSKYILPV